MTTRSPAALVLAAFLAASSGASLALGAAGADADHVLVKDFEDASAFAPNDDHGDPPAFELVSRRVEGAHGLRLVYRNGRSGWGNLRTPAEMRDFVEAVSLMVLVESAAPGAYINLWFFESDGDGWTAGAPLDALPGGFSRVRMRMSDFRHEKRGDGRPDLARVRRMLIGLSGADATVVLDDLRYEGRGLRARWEALMRARSEVTVDLKETVVASWVGMGVQWDPYDNYPLSPKKWERVERRLGRLEPAFFRVMTNGGVFCRYVNSEGGHSYIWQDPREKHAGSWRHLDQLLAILGYAQSRGWHVMLGEWGPPWIDVEGTSRRLETHDPRWARIVADYVAYLRREKGFDCIRYYNLVNEPNGDWSGNRGYESWRDGIRNLHAEFRARSLDAEVAIVGPDTTGSTKWPEPFTWLDRVAGDLSREVGVYDLHWYAHDDEVFGGELERLLGEKRELALRTDALARGKRMFLGESGILTGRTQSDQQHRVKRFEYGVMMADYAAQVGRAGWMGLTAWDLDDAMHTNVWKDLPARPEERVLKVWGFWNSAGEECGMPDEERCRPWFYAWTLMSRLFPRGSVIVRAKGPELERFRVLAGTDPRGRDLSVVLVNNSDDARKVTLRAPGAPRGPLARYHYLEGDMPAGEDGVPRPKDVIRRADLARGLEVELPSRGVVFLTTRAGDGRH